MLKRKDRTLLWIVLTAICSFPFFYPMVVISQPESSYYPATFTPVDATRYVSGSVSDLQLSDGVGMVFQSYPSEVSPQSLYAHQETITMAGAEYHVLSLDVADKAGTNLSVPLPSNERKLLGEFTYPLTGVTSIPASTWTIYYRAWLSNVSEKISANSPSWVPQAFLENAEHAYSSDDAYAYSSVSAVRQEYGNYGLNLPPTASITKVEVGYEAYTVGDEQISIALSWDGGIHWTADYVSPSLGTTDPDIVSWVDFTTTANWTASMFSDTDFRSRVAVTKVGPQRDDVFLDWLPVRVTYMSSSASAHVDVNVHIRKSDGSIRQTLAVNVADSEPLSATVQTLPGIYDWSGYTVVDETDHLEIDYYVDVVGVDLGAIACLRIDDSALTLADQTRVANIMLSSEQPSPSPQWNWIWALLSVPFLILLSAIGIGWKRRKNRLKSVGFEFLNEITDGGIPDSFSVMLVGGSDSGKGVLFQELAHVFLKMEKPCVYVAYECFPDEIRENMKKFQWDTSTYESQGKLLFVDCFSSSAKVQSREKWFLNQPFSLVDLGIIISKATKEAGNGVKVFVDSIVSLLTQLDPAIVVDFLQDRIARLKGVQGNLIFTLNKESVDPALMSQLEETVDCIIELDANSVKGEIVRKLRIKKMRGRNASDKWVQFEIRPEKGIVFQI